MKNGVKLLFPWLWSNSNLRLGLCFYLSRGFWADGRSLGSTAGPGARRQGSPHCPPEYLCSRFCHHHRPPLPLHFCPPPPLFHPHLPPHPRCFHCSGAWVAPTCPGSANVFVVILVIFIVIIIIITSLICRFYRVCVWTLVALLFSGFLVIALNVLNLIVLGVFGDEILEGLGHLVLQSICLTICDLQKDRNKKNRLKYWL